MFRLLGRLVQRYWLAVLLLWALGVALLHHFAPPFSEVTKDEDIRFFPPEYPTVRGYSILSKAFPEDVGSSEIVVLVRRTDGPLSTADFAFVDLLTTRLDELRTQYPEKDYRIAPLKNYRTPVMGELLTSEDRRATIIVTRCGWPLTASKIIEVVQAVRDTIGEMRDRKEIPPGIDVAVTGSAAVGADMQIAQLESLERSHIWTIILVVSILLLVYRSPLLPLIPLTAITLAIIVSKDILASLSLVPGLNFQVMKITDIFIVVLLFGAGTDYCLFLIARFREELEHGRSIKDAVSESIAMVGAALAASAGTVICGLATMYFARFGKISYTGPAVAVSLLVALFACLTLAPAMLCLFGPYAFWPFKIRVRGEEAHGVSGPLGERFWDATSRALVRRPGAIWLTATLLMLPFALWAPYTPTSYDFLAELSEQRESKRGYELLAQHYPPGELGPLMIVLDSSQELTGREAIDTIRRLGEEIKQVDHVVAVRSIADPLGKGKPPTEEEQPRRQTGGLFGSLTQIFQPIQRTAMNAAVMNYYISPKDRSVTRLFVVFDVPPFSTAALDTVERVADVVEQFVARNDHPLSHAALGLGGTPAAVNDLRNVTQADQRRINILVVVAVYAVLVLLLGRPGFCVYLLLTVLFSYFATLGITDLVFRTKAELLGQPFHGLDWKVSFFLFVILVAVGEDYNIFLMSRVVEEQEKRGPIDGLSYAVARTGGIISSCGLIMAGTFFSMLTGTLTAIIELGFALGFGVLLDTFVVRPMLVPALLMLLLKWRGEEVPSGETKQAAPEAQPAEPRAHPVA